LAASQVLREEAASHLQMEIRLGTTVEEFRGDGKLSSVVINNIASGKTEELTPGAVFIFIGLDPNVDFVKGAVDMDKFGFIATAVNLETACLGVSSLATSGAAAPNRLSAQSGKGQRRR